MSRHSEKHKPQMEMLSSFAQSISLPLILPPASFPPSFLPPFFLFSLLHSFLHQKWNMQNSLKRFQCLQQSMVFMSCQSHYLFIFNSLISHLSTISIEKKWNYTLNLLNDSTIPVMLHSRQACLAQKSWKFTCFTQLQSWISGHK